MTGPTWRWRLAAAGFALLLACLIYSIDDLGWLRLLAAAPFAGRAVSFTFMAAIVKFRPEYAAKFIARQAKIQAEML